MLIGFRSSHNFHSTSSLHKSTFKFKIQTIRNNYGLQPGASPAFMLGGAGMANFFSIGCMDLPGFCAQETLQPRPLLICRRRIPTLISLICEITVEVYGIETPNNSGPQTNTLLRVFM